MFRRKKRKKEKKERKEREKERKEREKEKKERKKERKEGKKGRKEGKKEGRKEGRREGRRRRSEAAACEQQREDPRLSTQRDHPPRLLAGASSDIYSEATVCANPPPTPDTKRAMTTVQKARFGTGLE